jgi:hypothetical protein
VQGAFIVRGIDAHKNREFPDYRNRVILRVFPAVGIDFDATITLHFRAVAMYTNVSTLLVSFKHTIVIENQDNIESHHMIVARVACLP